jgi:hypothetical protein
MPFDFTVMERRAHRPSAWFPGDQAAPFATRQWTESAGMHRARRWASVDAAHHAD